MDAVAAILLKLLAYTCLAGNLDVAYTCDIQSQSSKLNAVLLKSLVSHSTVHNKSYLTQTWMCLKQFLNNDKLTNGTSQDISSTLSIANLRDRIFVESIRNYWGGLTGQERGSTDVQRRLNSWCRYFAVLSQSNMDERIGIAKEDRGRACDGKLESDSPMSGFVTCVLKSLEVLSSGDDYEDPTCVADVLDLSLYSQVFDSENVSRFAASVAVCEKHSALVELAKSSGVDFEMVELQVKEGEENGQDADVVDESALVAVRSRLSKEFASSAMEDSNVSENDVGDDVDEFDGVSEEVLDWLSSNPLKDILDHKATKALSKVPY